MWKIFLIFIWFLFGIIIFSGIVIIGYIAWVSIYDSQISITAEMNYRSEYNDLVRQFPQAQQCLSNELDVGEGAWDRSVDGVRIHESELIVTTTNVSQVFPWHSSQKVIRCQI